jgi:molybdate transport system permease protein
LVSASPNNSDARRAAAARDGLLNALSLGLAAIFVATIIVALVALFTHAQVRAVMNEFQNPIVRQALVVSLETTAVAAVAIALFGTPLAALLARPFPGRAVLETIVTLPIVLPPVVAGLGLLLAFGRMGLLGHALRAAGIELPFTTAAVVLAQVFVAAPLYIVTAKNALERIDPDMLDAATTLRASTVYTMLRVAIPPALPALGAGLALAWARALGEFGATITFAGSLPGVTQTMPIAVYTEGQTSIETAIAIAIALLTVSFVVLLAARLLSARTLST